MSGSNYSFQAGISKLHIMRVAGGIVESVAGLSRARHIVKLCGFNIILSDPMDITETEQQKNDYFSQ